MNEKQFDPKRVRRWRRDVWRELATLGFKPAEMFAGMVLVGVRDFGTDPLVLSELTGSSTVVVSFQN